MKYVFLLLSIAISCVSAETIQDVSVSAEETGHEYGLTWDFDPECTSPECWYMWQVEAIGRSDVYGGEFRDWTAHDDPCGSEQSKISAVFKTKRGGLWRFKLRACRMCDLTACPECDCEDNTPWCSDFSEIEGSTRLTDCVQQQSKYLLYAYPGPPSGGGVE
jgi:hypothetical protein